MDVLAAAALNKAQKANKALKPYGFGESRSEEAYTPKFVKLEGDPIYTAAKAQIGSMYWFRPIEVGHLIPNAKGRFYATYSTNHNNVGGIGLAYADKPEGPWIRHGQVYLDTVVGNSTETPFVLWNDKEKKFFMYYQQAGAGLNQSTMLATSTDMLTWTREAKVMLDKPPGFPGDGHTGYFAAFKFAEKYVGFSVMGGGDFGRKAIWWSVDGRNWLCDPNTMLGGNDATLNSTENFSRSNAGLFEYRGQLWWLGMLSAYASGGTTTVARPAIAKIATSLKQLISIPELIMDIPTLPWETTNMQSMTVCVFDGTIYVYYNTDANVGLAYSVEV
ncbi:Glycosyl hydrolases family 43 [compost metagenome]